MLHPGIYRRLKTKVVFNYPARPDAAVTVYRDLDNQPGGRIIVPAMHEAVKAVTARYTAEELISKRAIVRNDIVDALRERMAWRGLVNGGTVPFISLLDK